MVAHNQISSFVLENYIPVKAAAEYSGYSLQYLRRLLRLGKLEGIKIGQVWLIAMASFEAYLENANHSADQRFGPK
jgi:excisionase family DNA binding protein